MATPNVIFYTAKVCPYSQRVELAFQEAKADVTRYWVNLYNKPEWYNYRVNPASKVPAVLYGGANSDPEDPSPDSAKITESLVLLEFIADLYPDSGLLPKDPVERARARFFIDAITTKLIPPSNIFFFCGNASEPFVTALAEIQDLLPLDAQFAVGDYFTIADAALAPFLGRWELYLRNDVDKFREGTYLRVYEEVFKSEHFARFQKYYASISSRESFKSSFDSTVVMRDILEFHGAPID